MVFTSVALTEVFSSCYAQAMVRGGTLNPDLAAMVEGRGIVLKTMRVAGIVMEKTQASPFYVLLELPQL